MNKNKNSLYDILLDFDKFEQNFITNINKELINLFFNNLAINLENSNLTNEELTQIKDRLAKTRELIANKKQDLLKQSVDILGKKEKINRYINNSYRQLN